MRELYVAFTMDCERIASESPPGGPETWELSERAISGYCDFLLESDLYPTLFIVPECAKKHRPLFGTLSRKGVELGLHLHPQSFDKHQYCKYLGEYERDDQLRIIGESRREFTRALGAEPKSFRSGNFSANDDTFPVLDSLGFLQGSVSDPGRNAPGFAATWMGACPDPHWASGVDRRARGNLRFLEVPVTTDPDCLQPNGFPYELRIESGCMCWHRRIIDRHLERIQLVDVELPCLCIFTHNFFDYSHPRTEQSRTLSDTVEYILGLDEYRVVPGTLSEIREAFIERVGEP